MKKDSTCLHKALSWIAVILWMILIFCLSAQVSNQSSELSSGVTQAVINIIEKLIPSVNIDIDSFHHFIRKCAHFIAYLVLGILSINALNKGKLNSFKVYIVSILICILYAISDETHQLFVPGRSGEITDVLIDSCGSALGILLYFIKDKVKK